MSWRGYKREDVKDDWRVLPLLEAVNHNFHPCDQCGDPITRFQGHRWRKIGISFTKNLKAKDVRVIRPNSRTFHYVQRAWFTNPEFVLGQPIFTRCMRYLSTPTQDQISTAVAN